ncbi:MAG TPA: alkaline phosphatase family protein [Thermoplasmata archaeon]|nr:alkaline phosphatase family protein [Thermoplasmata archaeon]
MAAGGKYATGGGGTSPLGPEVGPTESERSRREAASLVAPHPVLGVPIPSYRGRSLPNVTSSVIRALGSEIPGEPEILPPLAPEVDPFGGRRAEGPVVLLLVDGLGWSDPERSTERADSGYPAPWNERARPITTVFPTTTTVALTSLSTAGSPARHGVVGHRLYLPAFGVVAEILRMSPSGVATGDALAGPGWEPSMISGMPSVFRRGVAAIALTRDRFGPTAFTRMIYDGAEFVGFGTASDFAHRLGRLLGREHPPSLILAYWDDLDTVQHVHGPSGEFDAFEAMQVRQILAAARRPLPSRVSQRTTVVLTGDHGQVPAAPDQEIAIDRWPAIVAHLARPPTGDRRAAFLAARPGHLPSLRDELARVLPPGHHILPIPAALDSGLFGGPPFHPELSERLGDLLVLVPSPAAITYRLPGSPPRTRFLPGAHGGLDPAELLVPLVAGSLAEI